MMLTKLKDILFGATTLVFVLLVLIIGPRACQKCPPEGFILVKGSFIDSLQKVASMPPDTIRDTIRIKGDPVIVPRPNPEPIYINPADTTLKTYADSLQNDSIDAKVTMDVKGKLLKLTWEYRPLWVERTTTIDRPVPYPIPYEVPVKVPQTGLFLTFGLGKGFNIDKPALSGEIFYLGKKGGIVGAEAGYFNGGYFEVKFGTKIKFK